MACDYAVSATKIYISMSLVLVFEHFWDGQINIYVSSSLLTLKFAKSGVNLAWNGRKENTVVGGGPRSNRTETASRKRHCSVRERPSREEITATLRCVMEAYSWCWVTELKTRLRCPNKSGKTVFSWISVVKQPVDWSNFAYYSIGYRVVLTAYSALERALK